MILFTLNYFYFFILVSHFPGMAQNVPPQINVPRWFFSKKNVIVPALLFGTGEYHSLISLFFPYQTQHCHWPGSRGDHEADIPQLKACLSKLLQEWGIQASVKDDYVQVWTMCKYFTIQKQVNYSMITFGAH